MKKLLITTAIISLAASINAAAVDAYVYPTGNTANSIQGYATVTKNNPMVNNVYLHFADLGKFYTQEQQASYTKNWSQSYPYTQAIKQVAIAVANGAPCEYGQLYPQCFSAYDSGSQIQYTALIHSTNQNPQASEVIQVLKATNKNPAIQWPDSINGQPNHNYFTGISFDLESRGSAEFYQDVMAKLKSNNIPLTVSIYLNPDEVNQIKGIASDFAINNSHGNFIIVPAYNGATPIITSTLANIIASTKAANLGVDVRFKIAIDAENSGEIDSEIANIRKAFGNTIPSNYAGIVIFNYPRISNDANNTDVAKITAFAKELRQQQLLGE